MAAVLVVHAALLGWGAVVNSPTVDEFGHLAGGVWVLETGRFDVFKVNGPLVRTLAAAPAFLCGARSDRSEYYTGPRRRPEFTMGLAMVNSGGVQAGRRWFVLGRWACIPLSVIGACVCLLWGRELYGSLPGIFAMGLWCFCPAILGHGQLITPDVGAAALGSLACYAFWRWLRGPDWPRAFFAGVALGLAELTKMTWIVLFVLWPAVWMIWQVRAPHSRRPGLWKHGAAQLAAILLLGVYVVNVGYAFEGSFRPLGDYDFVSRTLGGASLQQNDPEPVGNRFRGTWLGAIPVPLPANYVLGIDLQKMDFERGRWSYLRGEWRLGGWWYYYLYAMGVKVPLGTWVLVALASVVGLFVRGYTGAWRDEVMLLAPLAAVLLLVSSQTGFSHHMRYVLPIFLFAFVWMSKVARAVELRHWKLAAIAGIALAWSVASSLCVYPHSVSYFNGLAGGPENGHNHLLDSNIDWGQDVFHLKRWLDAHPEASPIGLAYWGLYPPELAGIRTGRVPPMPDPEDPEPVPKPRTAGPQPGWYAVSVNTVHGYGMGGLALFPYYNYFLRFEPVAMAGYSIYIYHITPEEANRVRRELGLPELCSETEDAGGTTRGHRTR